MYDAGKIFAGLIIFILLVTSPFWYNRAMGKSLQMPVPKIVTTERLCVLPRAEMRARHMALLDNWRQTVVRTGERTYVTEDGRRFNMSLTLTCMKCHPNKSEFCDKCHNYEEVQPICWNCHVTPEEKPK